MNFNENYEPDKINKYLEIIDISPDISYLSDNQKRVLSYLIEATKIIDDLFYIQKYPQNLELKRDLLKLNDKKSLVYFTIQQGPFNQFKDNLPYIDGIKKNDRGGFYPEDLTISEWEEFLKQSR